MVMRYGTAVIGASLLVAALALNSGCAPRVQNLGNAPTARALDEVGCFSIVVEGVPVSLGKDITSDVEAVATDLSD